MAATLKANYRGRPLPFPFGVLALAAALLALIPLMLLAVLASAEVFHPEIWPSPCTRSACSRSG